MTQTDAEFVEMMAARARRRCEDGAEVVDTELERLVGLAREGAKLSELEDHGCEAGHHSPRYFYRDDPDGLLLGEVRCVVCERDRAIEQIADAEARVRELEVDANEVEDALEVWSSMPCGCVPPKDGTHASLAELSKCLLDGAEARVRELTVRRAN